MVLSEYFEGQYCAPVGEHDAHDGQDVAYDVSWPKKWRFGSKII